MSAIHYNKNQINNNPINTERPYFRDVFFVYNHHKLFIKKLLALHLFDFQILFKIESWVYKKEDKSRV